MAHDHHPKHHHTSVKNLKIAFFVNLGFTLIEFVGGLWTNSTAILADAVHDLGDSVALGQAWYFESLSDKKGNLKYTYGYRRFTLLGAAISALILLAASFYVLSEAIPRIIEPEPSNAQGMAILAIFGIAVNGFAMRKLAKGEGINIQVVALHFLEDVLGWVAVLIVAVILMFKDIHILDPILAVLITLYILANILKQLKRIVPVFLQATPDAADIAELEKQIAGIENASLVHHLHVWSLDGQHMVLTVHVTAERDLNADEYSELKQEFRRIVETHGINHSTIEIELPEEACRVEENEFCQ
jgi:cobalt-zinc-cadmium efflux system protein